MFTRRTPLVACLWLLMDRLFTGGLNPLASVGKIHALMADLDKPVTGQRVPDFGN